MNHAQRDYHRPLHLFPRPACLLPAILRQLFSHVRFGSRLLFSERIYFSVRIYSHVRWSCDRLFTASILPFASMWQNKRDINSRCFSLPNTYV